MKILWLNVSSDECLNNCKVVVFNVFMMCVCMSFEIVWGYFGIVCVVIEVVLLGEKKFLILCRVACCAFTVVRGKDGEFLEFSYLVFVEFVKVFYLVVLFVGCVWFLFVE